MSFENSLPRAIEEHSSLLADWTVHSTDGGFVVCEHIRDTVKEYGPLPDQTAAGNFIADRRDKMEAHLQAMVRMSHHSHH
jgi:hypothetical protein